MNNCRKSADNTIVSSNKADPLNKRVEDRTVCEKGLQKELLLSYKVTLLNAAKIIMRKNIERM